MSAENQSAKSSVCVNFEPQAWRKTVCKNCFQPPEQHVAGGVSDANSKLTNANKGPSPVPGGRDKTSPVGQQSAASSLKDKYEQLEKDKFKPKEPPKVPPKVAPKSKPQENITSVTGKYEQSVDNKPNIPPGTLPKQNINHTIQENKTGNKNEVTNLTSKSKFGSAENISVIDNKTKLGTGQRSKFGSMENISFYDKKKESVQIPIQKSKFGGSMDSISVSEKENKAQPDLKKLDLKSKLDAFTNELKAGATSKAGATVIHKQKDGHVDIITIPVKKTETTKTKDQESLQNELNEQKLSKSDSKFGSSNLKSKFEKPALSSAAQENDNKSKFQKPKLKSSTPVNIETPEPKTTTRMPELKPNKLEITTSTLDKEKQTDFKSKIDMPGLKSTKTDLKSPTPEKDNKSDFKMKLNMPGLKSTKPDMKSPTPEKDTKPEFKLKSGMPGLKSPLSELKSPTPEKDKAPDFRTKIDMPGLKSTKSDIKSPTPEKDIKPEFKLKSSMPGLKSPLSELKSPTPEKDKAPDFRTKIDMPDLKSTRSDLKSAIPEQDKGQPFKMKIEKPDLKSTQSELKSPTPEKDKGQPFETKNDRPSLKPTSFGLKSPTTDKDKASDFKTVIDRLGSKTDLKKDLKSSEKDTKQDSKPLSQDNDIKSRYAKPELKPSTTDKDKHQDSISKVNKPQLKNGTQIENTDTKGEALNLRNMLKKSEPKKSEPKSNDDSSKVTSKTDTKSKFELPSLKSSKPESAHDEKQPVLKNKYGKPDIRSEKEESSNKKTDTPSKFQLKQHVPDEKDIKTNKYEPPKLKSTRTDINDNKYNLKSKFETEQSKSKPLPLEVKDNKFNLKSKYETPELRGVKKDGKLDSTFLKSNKDDKSSKSEEKDKKLDFKSKFSKPELKSSTSDDTKSKFEKPSLKSTKLKEEAETKNELKSKLEKPVLSMSKDDNKLISDSKVEHSKLTSDINDSKEQMKLSTVDGVDSKLATKTDPKSDLHSEKVSANEHHKYGSNIDKESIENENKRNPPASSISDVRFGKLSTDGEATSGDGNDACVPSSVSTRENAHVHVDTQVFVSSKNKAAGVIGVDENSLFNTTQPLTGLSNLGLSKNQTETSEAKQDLQNVVISPESASTTQESEKVDTNRKSSSNDNDSVIEKLRLELLNMTDRCSNLDKENAQLREGMSKHEGHGLILKKQRDEVGVAIQDLQRQLQSMEDRCVKVESENINLLGNLKAQHESNKQQPHTKETDEMDEKLTANERLMEDMIEENELLKEEIVELKAEMEEMYDSFRDQEAEEFRELQKELEITAKNCRILQFKLRKVERRNDQIEHDKNQYQEKLRVLQSQFHDRDAVSHIRSLEDELRMAKDVSVRLHDELDLMEDKRGKVEEENRHLTELLEQADRKQFRLELEVDKLRDKVVELRQDLRSSGPDGGEKRKMTLELAGRQSSQEMELQGLKRELYDSKEREADLKDQMLFLQEDGKTLKKKLTDLEEENDNLSRQLKKMSIQHASPKDGEIDTSSAHVHTEKEIELKIQFELTEKELLVLKRKMVELDEENEMLHDGMFVLEKKLKEKDRLLQILPEPTSPNVYYEDKIKEYEHAADEFRTKLLEKETEIEHLYAQLQTVKIQSHHSRKLRKSKSLDLETDYNLVVDLKRQLELSQQECFVLKDKVILLEEENEALLKGNGTLKHTQGFESGSSITALAVAYIDTENEAQLRLQLSQIENAKTSLEHEIEQLAGKVVSLTKRPHPASGSERISTIPKIQVVPDELIKYLVDPLSDNVPNSDAEESKENSSQSRDLCQTYTFTCTPLASRSNCIVSDEDTGNSEQTINENISLPRDPFRLLSVIDEVFSNLVKQLCEMESGIQTVVPSDLDKPEGSELPLQCFSPELGVLSEGKNLPTESELTELIETPVRMDISGSLKMQCPSDTWEYLEQFDTPEVAVAMEQITSTDEYVLPKINATQIVSMEVESSEQPSVLETISPDQVDSKNAEGKTTTCQKKLLERIAFLEEEVEDLRIIIHSKEEKNLLLEEEMADFDNIIKTTKADSRRREMELLEEMDLIHGKNEILNNLLEIVKDRAEAAEIELEQVITEFNEAQDSSVSSERSAANTESRNSDDGSDDVFDGSPAEKVNHISVWEEQFKKRIRSLETLLAEERKKVTTLETKLEICGRDVISSVMSDDAKLHIREKELLQSELQESQRHAIMANDQIRSLTDKLKKVESDPKWRSPKFLRKPIQTPSISSEETEKKEHTYEPFCKTCSELQSVKDQLCEELVRFKNKAEELELKVEEINEIWVSKSAASEKEKQMLEQKLKQRTQECKTLEDQLSKLREEDRMKDIFLKERDNSLKDKSAQITRKEELLQEQEDIIRQREEDLQSLFDQISQREKTIKEITESIRVRDERLKEKDDILKCLNNTIEEKNEELHYLEEEMQDTTKKRKESETLVAEMTEKINQTMNGAKSELETENERLKSDLENLMGNVTELHTDKMTLQNELDKAKQALSEAMLMWDRDRSSLGKDSHIAREKARMYEMTSNIQESQALQTLRKEVNLIIESKEKLAHELRLTKMELDNQIRILKTDKFKLTEELTSKIRMLTHEMSNNDKMSDELFQLRGQDDINYQLHHHEKILRAEYMGMKVRYETQLERLQKEHIQLLTVVERLQREKNLDNEIIVGIQNSMSNIRSTYTTDLTRWKDERNVLESHITQIEEGKEIALHLKAQIDALKRQLADQDIERTELVNRMTSERRDWDVEKSNHTSKMNQLEEQLAVFIQLQSKSQDVQFRMEIAWEKERAEQKRLLTEAHAVAMDLQDQLQRRDEEHTRERNNLMDQLEKQRHEHDEGKLNKDKMTLELNTGGTRMKHVERQMEELVDKHKKEQDFWMREKGDLLRRFAEMRKIHTRDVRRIDDVLTSLKRLRELAAIVIESDNSAMLPSNGMEGATASGDASAASDSATPGGSEMGDIKQNIDQVILKYVKESLRQIHFAAEELSRPVVEVTREERQKLRRSLSSSEIELLKDEFTLGPLESSTVLSRHETIPEVKSQTLDRERVGLRRRITHDGSEVNAENLKLPPDYIENILLEQSSFYRDEKGTNVEIRRVKTTKDVTRVETKITTLPKPPPSFIIPRSRSISPAPNPVLKSKQSHPIVKSIAIDTSNNHRLSAPIIGAGSRSSSADSSPIGNFSPFIPSTQNGLSSYVTLQSGSLDRLSPSTARKNFFEAQPRTSVAYMSWPERSKQHLQEKRNSRSLSNSLELCDDPEQVNTVITKGHLRTSVSMDDGVSNLDVLPNGEKSSKIDSKRAMAISQSSVEQGSSKHSGLRDMFRTIKRKLKPKLKRSHSAREPDSLKAVIERDQADDSKREIADDKRVLHERMTPIPIPDESEKASSEIRNDDEKQKRRSRSPSTKSSTEKEGSATPESTLRKIKKRFRSKSADRAPDRQVTPILVGHSSGSQTYDSSCQFSETTV